MSIESIDLFNYILKCSSAASAGLAGKDHWNAWREQNPEAIIDFSRHNFCGANFTDFNLSYINFSNANLSAAKLVRTDFTDANLAGIKLNSADLTGANLTRTKLNRFDPGKGWSWSGGDKQSLRAKQSLPDKIADLKARKHGGSDEKRREDSNVIGGDRADLSDANLTDATLIDTDLSDANLSYANFTNAHLSGVNLNCTTLIETIFNKATLTDCSVYGCSAWNLKLEESTQYNLIVTNSDESTVKVDDIEVAQFVYLLLHNGKIRNVINTIGEKGVLILGRFTKERKLVLDAIRDKLRQMNYVPLMFDFESPDQRDFTETILILAGMSRFIIADITNPRSSPLELQALMPDYMIPFVPIIQQDEEPFAMFQDLKNKYGTWVLDVLEYDSTENLIQVFDKAIVNPALKMSEQLMLLKNEKIRKRHVLDYK